MNSYMYNMYAFINQYTSINQAVYHIANLTWITDAGTQKWETHLSCGVTILYIIVRLFLVKNIIPKLASQYLYGALAVLVRRKQAHLQSSYEYFLIRIEYYN